MQAMKTGALLRFGCLLRAMLGKAEPSQRQALARYGSALGEAFQIADDLLDLEGDPATVGKATGKDAAAHKATLVGVLGPAAARRRLRAWLRSPVGARSPFGRPCRRAEGGGTVRRNSSGLNRAGIGCRRERYPLGTAGWTRTTDLLVHSQAL